MCVDKGVELSAPKPILVFATPRSGSTLYYQIIAEYFRQLHGLAPLGEYFNIDYHRYSDAGDGIRETRWAYPIYDHTPEHRNREAVERVALLRKYYERYSLKVFPSQVTPDTLLWLRDRFEWICVERRNLFEQFLSFAISELTGVWWVEDGSRVPKQSLVAPPELMKTFESEQWIYLAVKKSFHLSKSLVYEDFLENPDMKAALAKVGLHSDFDPLGVELPKLQNGAEKLQIFRNSSDLVNQYRDSFLSQLCPLARE